MIRYPSVISLPNLQLYFSHDKIRKEYLLIAGGRPPAVSWLQTAAINRAVYCIDHGADACRAAGLVPSVFIGDCDSISTDTRNGYALSTSRSVNSPSKKTKRTRSWRLPVSMMETKTNLSF